MSAEVDEVALPDLFDIFRRRSWVVALCVLLALLIGIRLSLGRRNYVADSLLRVQLGTESQYRSAPTLPSNAAADDYSPYVDILESRSLFLQVAKDLNLANNADFMGRPIAAQRSLSDPTVRTEVLRQMHARIAVNHKPKDEMIRVTCSTPNPLLSAQVVNTLVNDFVDELVQSHYGASKRSTAWLMSQLNDLKRQVEQDQSRLTALQARLGIVGLDDKGADYLLAQTLGSLTKAASQATVDRIVAEAKYRFLNESDPSLIEGEISVLGGQNTTTPGSSSLLQSLRSAQGVQASEYARLLQKYGPNFPQVTQSKAQLDETTRQVKQEQARIVNQAKLSYSAATANEQLTQKELQDTQGKAYEFRNDMVQYVILQHDYESHRALYEGLVSRLQEAGITAGLGAGAVDILDLADVPTQPAPPGRLTYLAGSLLAGLVLGIVLALVLEALSTRLTTADQLRRAVQLPLLSTLPVRRSSSLQLAGDQDSAYIDSIEVLRSSVLGNLPPPKVILVTSSTTGEGKSTTAAYLAAVLAQHGRETLLVDCDLRRNSLGERLGLSSQPGLTSLLTEGVAFESALQSIAGVSDLKVLVAGSPAVSRSAILLGSDEFNELMLEARRRFRFVVLNCPPVLGLPDVLNVGPHSDAIVLVSRSKVTRRKNLELALKVLTEAHFSPAGVVLNGLSSGERSYPHYEAASREGAGATT